METSNTSQEVETQPQPLGNPGDFIVANTSRTAPPDYLVCDDGTFLVQ